MVTIIIILNQKNQNPTYFFSVPHRIKVKQYHYTRKMVPITGRASSFLVSVNPLLNFSLVYVLFCVVFVVVFFYLPTSFYRLYIGGRGGH